MKKIWLICSCLFISFNLSAQKKNTAKNAITKEPVINLNEEKVLTSVEKMLQEYKFEEASSLLQKELATARKKKLITTKLEEALNRSTIGANMLRGTERVVIIDSFVVARDQFLRSYKISPDCGIITTYTDVFKNDVQASRELQNSTVYLTELGDKMYYSYPDNNGLMKLCTRDKLDNTWSEARFLQGLNNGNEVQQYPFVLSDGITLYYSAQGEESLGGFDIYVTRYSSDHNQYLKPENIGMPFNSPANDFMYAVDEINNLGWFVSDRYQPVDKVCIYIFIPNKSRDIYTYTQNNSESVRRAARICSIMETWGDKNAVNEARERLKEALVYKEETEYKGDFSLIIDDKHTYTTLSQFKDAKAKQMCVQWKQATLLLKQQREKLDAARIAYSLGNSSRKNQMKTSILGLEQDVYKLELSIANLEKNMRNIEIKTAGYRK